MLNAASKFLSLFAIALFMTACGNGKANRNAAQALLNQAAEAITIGEYSQAQELLDSMSKTYPKEIELGRQAMKLRPAIIEGKTIGEIAEKKAELQYLAQFIDSVSKEFKSVEASKDVFEPYMVHKSVPNNWRDKNTAVSRINPAGDFIVISSLAGNKTHHTALRLTSANGVSVTSGTVPFDSSLKLSRESVRFTSEQADTLGVFAMTIDGGATLDFVGGKKAPSAKLSAKEVKAMASTYKLSKAIRTSQASAYRLEQLQAKLQLARDQSARLNNAE
jgi:hypothetical protein